MIALYGSPRQKHIQKLIENYLCLMYYTNKTIYLVYREKQIDALHNKEKLKLLNFTVEHILWHSPNQRTISSGNCYALFLFLRGTAAFHCSEVLMPVNQETMVIFKPGEAGTLVNAGAHGPLECIRVQFPTTTLQELSNEETNLARAFDVVPFRQIAVRPDNEIYMLLKNLARKLCVLPNERNSFGASLFENGILKMFVVLVLRACIQAESHKAQISRHHLMLDDVFLYIQAHLDEEITLKQLEEHFFVSHEHISREFKRQTGQTLHTYITKAKLDRCCRFIEQGYPITEVYQKVGFGGYNSFFRAFKKEYGMTPKEYFRTTQAGARG